MQVGRVVFGIFLKSASGLVPDGWVELKSFGYRCYFRAFQIKLDILDTQNFGNGPVVEELQPFEVGAISRDRIKKVLPYFKHFATHLRSDNDVYTGRSTCRSTGRSTL